MKLGASRPSPNERIIRTGAKRDNIHIADVSADDAVAIMAREGTEYSTDLDPDAVIWRGPSLGRWRENIVLDRCGYKRR
jgi:hypothetical protein